MSGVSDKARFYLERSVPQLREWEQKEIFSKDEIRNIVQKRNDFEHKVLSPGNVPSQWSAYASWEQSLEALRAKRCNRLKMRRLHSAHTGEMRIMAIYERAVQRHGCNGALWREYLAYVAKVKASKRWRKAMANALRMLPTDSGLWIIAGRRSAQNGDMASARSFYMRGCRFCTQDSALWLDYARCEMEWLRKLEARKKKPNVDVLRPDKVEDGDMLVIDSDEDDENDDLSGQNLPQPSAAQNKVIDKQAAEQLKSNPAMDGAIPMAIFEISRKQGFFGANVAEEFFVMFASFADLPMTPKISQTVMDVLEQQYPKSPATCNCNIRKPILGLSPYTAEFPRNLRDVLARLKESLATTTDRAELEMKTELWINEYLAMEDLDKDIRAVLEFTKQGLPTL